MTSLTDRMRTCAAHILASDAHEYDDEVGLVMRDAADLLIEASNLIEPTVVAIEAAIVAQKNTPMEIIPPIVNEPDGSPDDPGPWTGSWIAPADTLPVAARLRPPRACPRCDSRANKTVRRDGNHLMLVCPVCGHTWEFK